MSALASGGGGAGEAAASASSPAPAPAGLLADFGSRVDFSYLRDLHPDPQEAANAPNTATREVYAGHYVRVAPKAMVSPYLVLYSKDMAATLGLTAEECASDLFLRIFSGDLQGAPGLQATGWATPYALSIYGSPIEPSPNAGPSGYGYGDGRAISIAEVLLPGSPPGPGRLELQLKGSGPTPFRRGGDGAAVLRSSVREFLASEAMHAMGVPTTRALSLTATAAEVIHRPWRNAAGHEVMTPNRRAITTRVAASFLRVGQFELYGRRAARGEAVGRQELALLARHALAREYPHLLPAEGSEEALQGALLAMLRECAGRFAALAAHWLRVGYVQSNFNADNCLVGGVTMDYGPFGYLELYDPTWGHWVGTGDHYAYLNQPTAMGVNFGMLLRSLLPLFSAAGRAEAADIFKSYPATSARAVSAMWASKMGFPAGSPEEATGPLYAAMEALMREYPTDFTLLYRQLILTLPADFAAAPPVGEAQLLQLVREALEPALIAPEPPSAQLEGELPPSTAEKQQCEWAGQGGGLGG
jgi:uncharacterized protein YdiU (UPF0061 family)